MKINEYNPTTPEMVEDYCRSHNIEPVKANWILQIFEVSNTTRAFFRTLGSDPDFKHLVTPDLRKDQK